MQCICIVKPKRITIEGIEMLDRTVVLAANTGKIGVPASWANCDVVVVRTTEPAKVKE